MVSILSWNISNCKPSAASINWSKDQNANEIRAQILNLDPDIILLQEAPQYFCQSFEDYLYQNPLGEVLKSTSHCPFVFVLIHKRLKPSISSSVNEEGFILVNATLSIAGGPTAFTLASFHLAPYKENTKARIAQLECLRHHASDCESIHIFGGDSNMRKAEWAKTTLSGCYRDAWEECGSDQKTRWTWNSKINHYHKDGHKFACRFDRVFSIGSQKQKVVAKDFRVLGSHRTWFLSDHFGIFCKYELVNDGDLLDFIPYDLNGETVLVETSSMKTQSNLAVYKKIDDEDDEKLYHVDRSKLRSYDEPEENFAPPKKRKSNSPSEGHQKKARQDDAVPEPSKGQQVLDLVSKFVQDQGGFDNIDPNSFANSPTSNYDADFDEDLQRALEMSLMHQ